MSTSFLQYQLARARAGTAKAERDRAPLALELATIRVRLAEIESQHEPLASLVEGGADRRQLIAVAHYVVVGRWPA